ncbi:6618_t:CDS:2 [Diversispora eburnea]|uniref:6618_t:CDS:1 n=1 Tax=Diversispora eburnea TaxID=1213867 RepID=A0A9N9BVJ4_9GLOM|nr:6618_t:CDS:2 [Diversispora eburnea]
MSKLNSDCLRVLFENFTEESSGAYLLYNCALLDKQWNVVATPYLYRDPWQHWIYRSKNNFVAKKLIDTYHLCYQVHSSKTSEYNNNRGQHKRIRSIDNNSITINNIYLPQYDYIELAKNLHIPALYQCVEIWYKATHEDESVNGEIEKYFLSFLKLFVDKARIKGCTFAESSTNPSYPIQLDHLEYLAKTFNRLSVDLEYLNLGYFKCTDEALLILSKNCTSLKTFKITAHSCSDDALANFISSQKKLTKLKIRYAQDLRQTLDKIRSQAKTIVKLRILHCNLENCTVPLTGIAECINLRSIYMRDIDSFSPRITLSQLLMPIAKNCEFHNVDFTKTSLPVDVLVEIAKKSSTTLRRVHLIRPTHLREGGYVNENLSDGIMALANNATNLCAFERNILPEELNATCYLVNTIGKSLTRLEIESVEMADYDSSNLLICIGNKCPYLTILNISNYEFSFDSFVTLLKGCKYIQSLTVMFSDSINDKILELIAKYWAGTLKKTLEIDECHNVSIEAGSNNGEYTIPVINEAYNNQTKKVKAYVPPKLSSFETSICGAIAGGFSRFVVAPLDVIKIRLQLQPGRPNFNFRSKHRTISIDRKYNGIRHALFTIFQEEGLRGLWKGNLSAEYLYISYGAVQFLTYQKMQDLFKFIEKRPNNKLIFDKNITTIYEGIIHSIQNIRSQEGFYGFYRGISASIIQIIPYMSLTFGSYEFFKKSFQRLERFEENNLRFNNLKGSEDLISGAMAGTLGKTGVFPLDLLRKRLQIQGPDRSKYVIKNIPLYASSIISCIKQICKEDGFLGLYKGLSPAIVKSAFASAVTFFVYGYTKRILEKSH